MKKLITIPNHLVEPILLLAAKKNKGNLNACIVDCISKAIKTDDARPF